jgi:hypothetical protein
VTNKASQTTYSAIRKATVLLEHVGKEVIATIKKIERQNE